MKKYFVTIEAIENNIVNAIVDNEGMQTSVSIDYYLDSDRFDVYVEHDESEDYLDFVDDDFCSAYKQALLLSLQANDTINRIKGECFDLNEFTFEA